MTDAPAWDLPRPHVLEVEVLESHIDLMRHTNNVVYLQWLEDVAWDHSIRLGLGPDAYTALGTGVVVRQHELQYVRPTFLGDRLRLATWIVALDKVSLHRRYQFVRAADGATVFRGRTHFVCVEMATGRMQRMPPAFVAGYGAAVITPPDA